MGRSVQEENGIPYRFPIPEVVHFLGQQGGMVHGVTLEVYVLDRIKTVLLAGILICLLIIARKPVPSFSYSSPPPPTPIEPGETVIQLAPNRIAVVDNRSNSGMHGIVLVFQFDEAKKTFDFVGQYNYADFFNNPQNHGINVN